MKQFQVLHVLDLDLAKNKDWWSASSGVWDFFLAHFSYTGPYKLEYSVNSLKQSHCGT